MILIPSLGVRASKVGVIKSRDSEGITLSDALSDCRKINLGKNSPVKVYFQFVFEQLIPSLGVRASKVGAVRVSL